MSAYRLLFLLLGPSFKMDEEPFPTHFISQNSQNTRNTRAHFWGHSNYNNSCLQVHCYVLYPNSSRYFHTFLLALISLFAFSPSLYFWIHKSHTSFFEKSLPVFIHFFYLNLHPLNKLANINVSLTSYIMSKKLCQ